MKERIAIIILFTVLLYACKKGKEYRTESGLKYRLYNESKGPKVKIGDYVTLELAYRNNKDSVLFDSRKNKIPIRFKIEKIPFTGSFEEALTYFAANDSATVYVSADSLRNYLHKDDNGELKKTNDEGFEKGSYLMFEVKVLKIQNDSEAEEEMMLELSKRDKQERIDLNGYLNKINLKSFPDSSGYYLIMREKGNGATVDSGKVVTLEYEGRFLNDTVFDGTKQAGHPYKFISGAHHVIRGWEMAMKKLRAGDKFTLILPSKLAYGELGIRNPQNGMYVVPPYTPLVFDMEIVSVEDAPAVSGDVTH